MDFFLWVEPLTQESLKAHTALIIPKIGLLMKQQKFRFVLTLMEPVV